MISKDELDALLVNHDDVKKEVLALFDGRCDVALAWLKAKRPQLLGASAASIIDNDKESVLDVIFQIKTGDFS
ncbi:hypothetical protein ACQKE9_06305 [Shewanella vesiculosa]|uniref:hypothetical protein n=1 Tax=Shewanella vesiculosa TaxID=518738 RepID=UPI003D08B650